jgi:hypothetical protein
VRLDVEAAECSQRAFAVMDIRDKSVRIASPVPGLLSLRPALALRSPLRDVQGWHAEPAARAWPAR